jgi:hypothetical protein
METIDYNKPIFVSYIKIDGLSRQRAEEEIQKIIEDYSQIDVQMWFVPCHDGDSRIECVYPGMPEKEFTGKMKGVLDNLLSMLDGISGSSEEVIEKLKINIRNVVLNELIK